MPEYSIFGGCLSADMELSGLVRTRNGRPDWTLRTSPAPPGERALELLGEEAVEPDVGVRLYRYPGGFRIEYDDTGTFDIQAGGRRLTWSPGPRPTPESVELDLMGRVLPAALHAAGNLCLHASAVAFGDAGVAFAAPKLYGKSTLAQALVLSGEARLASDDVASLDLDEPVMLRPGVPRLRLRSDSAGHGEADVPTEGAKVAIDGLSPERILSRSVPLAAIYLLDPQPADPERPAVCRTRISGPAAAIGLVACAKLAHLLGKGESGVLLSRAARAATSVPVYSLAIVRDFQRLPEVVQAVTGWHADH
jgi:hypothetical protein